MKYRSKMKRLQGSRYTPHFFRSFFQDQELSDEVEFLQWGQSNEADYHNTILETEAIQSSWSIWPGDAAPDDKYKFCSVEVWFSQDKNVVERSTYSSLDWLGDIGGLSDALKLIARYFVLPFSGFALKQ